MKNLVSGFVICLLFSISGAINADDEAFDQDKNSVVSNSKVIRVFSEQSIDRLDIDQVTSLTLLSRLSGLSEAELNISISRLYSDLKSARSVALQANMAKFAVLLKVLIPALCDSGEGTFLVDNKGQAVSAVDLNLSHLSGLASSGKLLGSSIESDMRRYEIDATVEITKQLFPLLLLSKLACDSINQSAARLSKVDLVLNRAGYQTGSLVIMDPDNPAINELRELVSSPFGQTASEYTQAVDAVEAGLGKQGIEEIVVDAKIRDVDAYHEQTKASLETMVEVINRLAFYPSPPIEGNDFTFLGAGAVDVDTPSGYTGVISLYDSPIGKILVQENDLLASQGVTFITPEALNAVIGQHPASVVAYKGEESGNYYTEVYWYNSVTSREYTVEVSLNLNDESHKDSKELLFDVLTRHFGKYQ
ncbi:MAG: hypothetical protein COB61_011295 [Thiotrichales bacterium]|nr:hypothetical protein [Thiotrichales bacterium]